MKRFRKQFLMLLCVILMGTLLAACSGKADTINPNIISNGQFSVTVPDSWEGKYVTIIDDENIQLYQKAAYESFGGGWLCSFEMFNDEGYKELPSYEVLITGAETDAGTNQVMEEQIYIVTYPTDVQADLEDENSTSEYFEMYDQLPQIVESFVLED